MNQEHSGKFRLHKELPVKEARWDLAQTELMRRFGLGVREAAQKTSSFQNRLLRPFSASWYLKRGLAPADNLIAASLCTCHGADSLRLTSRRTVHTGAFALEYCQAIELQPRFKNGSRAGTCRAEITVALFGRAITFSSLWQILAFQAAFFLSALLSYIIVVGLLLYGTAVFVVFLRSPVAVAQAATRQASIGLGLLCYLMGLAVILRNLTLLASEKLNAASGERRKEIPCRTPNLTAYSSKRTAESQKKQTAV